MANEKIILITSHSPSAVESAKALKATLRGRQLRLDAIVVIAIGGDGTMLKAIKNYFDQDVLFVGVSAGHLGFLQSVEPSQISQLLGALENKSYEIIEAPLLRVTDLDDRVIGMAFNDVSVERQGPRAARFSLQIGPAKGTFIGDGVIFATPLGSTAYTLAAGGPIIDSRAQEVFVVTPNNPHVSELYSSLQRPHVLSGKRLVKLEVDANDATERPVQLVIDGQVVIEKLERPIHVGLSNRTVKLLELERDGFHSRIASKRLGRF